MGQYSEEDVKLKFITPAITCKWDKMKQVTMEYSFTDGQVIVRGNLTTRGKKKRADYLLSIKPNIPLAIVEAKDDNHPLGAGMQQGIEYARVLDVPFVYSSNGSGFLEHDMLTGKERELSLADFPTPEELWNRYKQAQSISDTRAKVISEPYYYAVGEKKPRYYQRIAINKAVDAVAQSKDRILITMATGTGKTYVAFQIVWRLWKAGIKKKILYLADRNILVDQTMANDFKPFEKYMTKVTDKKLDSSYEIYFALYQQLVSNDKEDILKILKQFKRDFFDLIIVDECHRGSAKEDSQWRNVLEYFNTATHIGMTATPKETKEVRNISYFGKPIYTYSLKQGIDDGFLAPYKVIRVGLNTDLQGYRPEAGKLDVNGNIVEDREYNIKDFEKTIIIDERTEEVAKRITKFLKETDRYAKTIVFCVDIEHAERMRQALINENSDIVKDNPRYIMRITGDNAEGKAQLDNFIAVDEKYPTIVTTSKLMTTGVDCKTCKLIVLENNISSMTEFKQIIGRGTRLNPKYGKEYFTIMDFREASRLFADPDFDGEPIDVYDDDERKGGHKPPFPPEPPIPPEPPLPPEPPVGKVRVRGVDVEILSERVQYYDKDGKLIVESLKDYTKRNILEKYATLDVFLRKWNETAKKQAIVNELKEDGILLEALRNEARAKNPEIDKMDDFDLVCHLAYDKKPLTKAERAKHVKKKDYLNKYSELAQKVLNALLDHYMNEGIEDLGGTEILNLDEFRKIASATKIVKEFGGKQGYLKAIKELEDELYSVAI